MAHERVMGLGGLPIAAGLLALRSLQRDPVSRPPTFAQEGSWPWRTFFPGPSYSQRPWGSGLELPGSSSNGLAEPFRRPPLRRLASQRPCPPAKPRPCRPPAPNWWPSSRLASRHCGRRSAPPARLQVLRGSPEKRVCRSGIEPTKSPRNGIFALGGLPGVLHLSDRCNGSRRAA